MLLTPESFYYGDREWAWEGRLEPKLFQRVTWLLVVPVRVVGKIPLISMITTSSGTSCVYPVTGIGLEDIYSNEIELLSMIGVGVGVEVDRGGISCCVDRDGIDVGMLVSGTGVCLSRPSVGLEVETVDTVSVCGTVSSSIFDIRTTKSVPSYVG